MGTRMNRLNEVRQNLNAFVKDPAASLLRRSRIHTSPRSAKYEAGSSAPRYLMQYIENAWHLPTAQRNYDRPLILHTVVFELGFELHSTWSSSGK